MEWEFTYVDLWLGVGKTRDLLGERQAEIARLGEEGWEPVGEIAFQHREANVVTIVNVRQLMFKRRVPLIDDLPSLLPSN
jgi:hypothetical protein